MEMQTMEKLEEMLCRELDEIAKKGKLTAGDLDTVHKLTDTIKNLDKIEMLEDDGYSQGMGDWEARGHYGGHSYDDGGNSYNDGGNSYNSGGMSYAGRRRDSRGRYSRNGGMYSRDGYSRGDGKETTTRELERMMGEMSGQERETIRKALDIVKRM